MDLQLARKLINAGHKLPEVKELTGITHAIFYQIKRDTKPVDFGCVVCGEKRKAFSFCRKHLWRYVQYPEYVRKLKAA